MAVTAASSVPGLSQCWHDLSEEDQGLATMLVDLGQSHLFADWAPGSDDVALREAFFNQVRTLQAGYPGGLPRYVEVARRLLSDSRKGVNPLEGWAPKVPGGGKFMEVGSAEWLDCERIAMEELGTCAFVVPAGGLGERLGFNDVKFALPTDLVSMKSVLGLYCHYLKSFQYLACERGCKWKLPLIIMTSHDTDEGVRNMLKETDSFGMNPQQIIIVTQEEVVALKDNEMRFATEGPYRIKTKPHGHGDIHHMLYTSTLVKKLVSFRKWVYFFQDSSTLYMTTFLCSLGVSIKYGFHINTVTMPRKAKEAVGAIAELEHQDGRKVMANVEYNQLDPMLRANGHPEGDSNGPDGWSPFPGNTNGIIYSMREYADHILETKGEVPEFINPKYLDAAKTTFEAVRLECMMQDIQKTLCLTNVRSGFTRYPEEFGYFPCKNSIAKAKELSQKGLPAHGAASAEGALYRANCLFLRKLGATVAEPTVREWAGGAQEMWPAVVFDPDFAPCMRELRDKLPAPSRIKIASGASVHIQGRDLKIDSMDIEGAVSVQVMPEASLHIESLRVRNRGHEFVALDEEEQISAPEILKIRGYKLQRHETEVIEVTEPGEWIYKDGLLRPKPAPKQEGACLAFLGLIVSKICKHRTLADL